MTVPKTLARPVTAPYNTTYPFGGRHWGADYMATLEECKAAHSGTVAYVRRGSYNGDQAAGGYGAHVILKATGGGYATLYAHLSSVMVVKGQKVNRGQVIGITGNTGISTGPHVHMELIDGWYSIYGPYIFGSPGRVNPELYYGEPPQQYDLEGDDMAGFITIIGAQGKTWLATANTKRPMASATERKDLAKALRVPEAPITVSKATWEKLKLV